MAYYIRRNETKQNEMGLIKITNLLNLTLIASLVGMTQTECEEGANHTLSTLRFITYQHQSLYRVSKNVLYPKMQFLKNFYYNKDNRIWYFDLRKL